MKKILMFFLVLIFLFSTKNVFAQDQYELTLEKHEDIYYSRYGKVYSSYPFMVFKFNDIFAYCIEPGNHITTYTYVEGDLDPGYSQEKLEKLELIGYYGRDYPSHDNIRYSMAAQALIWELTGADKVTFWTKKNEEGDEIDVSKEKNEIMKLVNNHYKLPSFEPYNYGSLKKEIILEDTNNVIDTFEIQSIHKTWVEGNKLHIIPQKPGTDSIRLKKKNYNNYETIIFVGKDDSNTQKMARLHFNKEIKTDFFVITDGPRLVVHKSDENNNPIKLENIKFKVWSTKGWCVYSGQPNCIHTTNKDGIFITKPLEFGEYDIEEMEDQIVPGYTWNKNKLHIVIDENTEVKFSDELGSYIDVTFNNQSIKGVLNINKVGEIEEFSNNEVLYKEKELSNIEFDIYDSNDILIDTLITDSNGVGKLSNLSLGKYYIKEKNKLDKYLDNGRINFEIKQIDQYQEEVKVNLNIKNTLKKGKLEFTKLDKDTLLGIPNTIIEIYNDENVLLFTRETDEDGKIIINDLPYGKYYIIEKEANSLYKITNEKIYFEIKEDKEIIKKEMINERIIIPVPKTRTNEDIIAHSIFGIVFLIGVGGMYYKKSESY